MFDIKIAGFSITSCLGTDYTSVYNSLKLGEVKYKYNDNREKLGYNVPIVAKPDLQLISEEEIVSNCVNKLLKEFEPYLVNAKIGIIAATDSCIENNIVCFEDYKKKHKSKSIKLHSSFDTLNSRLSILKYGLNPVFNITTSAACASGGHAIGLACMYLTNFDIDYVLVIGYQESNDYAQLSFDATRLFSKNGISKPFDKNRDGLIPSSGCACLLLTKHNIAENFGTILNYGFSTGIDKIIPDKIAIKHCMYEHIKYIKPYENIYINAHAVGTVLGDRVELQAINELYDNCSNKIFVTSTKAITGHECWMAGVSEIIYSLIQAHNNQIFKQYNFESSEIELVKNILIPTETIYEKVLYIISNNFGFGGSNSSILIKTNNSH